MARRKATAAPTAEETSPTITNDTAAITDGAEAPVRRRRRRRTVTPPDYSNETVTLVEAVLRGRGSKGATAEILQTVVNWARGVRAEGDALKELASRPRRQKTQAPGDRITRFEMNRALLDGVVAGTIALDIQEDGSLLFVYGAYAAAAAETTSDPVDSADESGI